MDFYYPDSPF